MMRQRKITIDFDLSNDSTLTDEDILATVNSIFYFLPGAENIRANVTHETGIIMSGTTVKNGLGGDIVLKNGGQFRYVDTAKNPYIIKATP